MWWCRSEPLSDEEALLGSSARMGPGKVKSPLGKGGTGVSSECETEDDELLEDHHVEPVSAN
jgi:hypothetical protein